MVAITLHMSLGRMIGMVATGEGRSLPCGMEYLHVLIHFSNSPGNAISRGCTEC